MVADQRDGDVVGEALAAEVLDVGEEGVEAGAVEPSRVGLAGEVGEQAMLTEAVGSGAGAAAGLDQAVGVEQQSPVRRQGDGGARPAGAQAEGWCPVASRADDGRKPSPTVASRPAKA